MVGSEFSYPLFSKKVRKIDPTKHSGTKDWDNQKTVLRLNFIIDSKNRHNFVASLFPNSYSQNLCLNSDSL